MAIVVMLGVGGCRWDSGRFRDDPVRVATSSKYTDEELLDATRATGEPAFELLNAMMDRAESAREELAKAPHVAASTIELVGSPTPAADPPPAPSGDPGVADAYEPDDTKATASELRVGQTRAHTIHRPGDVDWLRLPKRSGGSYYSIVSTGELKVEETSNRSEGEDATHREAGAQRLLGFLPDDDLLETTWLKISADGKAAYTIERSELPAQYELGEEVPGVSLMGFSMAVAGADPAEYYTQTGRTASESQLRALRDQLFGDMGDGGSIDYGISDPENSPVQRSYTLFDGGDTAVAYWIRCEKRGLRWVVVSAGRDASWDADPWKAKLDLYLSLSDYAMQHMMAGKPVIYLYPASEQTVTVRVSFPGELTTTSPLISARSDWTVRAETDGTLHAEDGRTYPYLFWEGVGTMPLDARDGAVVRGADVDAYLSATLGRLGLSAGESADFRSYWTPRLERSPWVFIHFATHDYARLVPLKVTPAPDSSVRVFMVARALDAPVAARPQALPVTLERHGFTLVEWGGTIISE